MRPSLDRVAKLYGRSEVGSKRRGETLDMSENLQPPDIIAEIAENRWAALEQFEEIAAELDGKPEG